VTVTANTEPASIDIHAHYRAPGQEAPVSASWVTEERRREAARRYEQMASFDRIVEVSDEAGVGVRVLSLPAASLLRDFDATPPQWTPIASVNEYLAEGVRAHPGRLLGLATIDAYSGEDGAREVRRAVDELGLSGIVIDSGKADTFIGVPETLPTLQEATRLGVPVFVHPTGTSLTPALARHAGELGNSYGRGLANGVALLGLIDRGVLGRIPGLRIVFTSLGIGALGIIGVWQAWDRLRPAGEPAQVYYDTMGFDPANVAYLISVLGASRVLLGSDFPHLADATRQQVAAALDGTGVERHDQRLIRADNAADLLLRKPARSGGDYVD
jgi:predicted TIM-barrel fold metal-dependent hydrolase